MLNNQQVPTPHDALKVNPRSLLSCPTNESRKRYRRSADKFPQTASAVPALMGKPAAGSIWTLESSSISLSPNCHAA